MPMTDNADAGQSRRAWLRSVTAFTLLGAAGGRAMASEAAGRAIPEGVWRLVGPGARPRGSARLRMFGLHIYDARFWAQDPFVAERFQASSLALELVYARSLKGERIAEASLQEMKRGGAVADADAGRWMDFMRKTFPDVKAGDQIIGVWEPREQRSSFFINGAPGPALVDAAFGERFFGIWLAPHTSQPEMRLRLLGIGSS